MALGKYARIDGHNSSRYCVIVVILVFISTCFLGAWMAMSTSIGPLGLGVHLQQFMGGMPKKVNLNDTNLHEDDLKVNASRSVVQDDSNLIMQENVEVTPMEPQILDLAQNDEVVPTAAEKTSSLNAEDKKGSQEKNSGPPEEADTSNQEVPTAQYVDSAVQPRDSDNQTGPDEVSNKTKQVEKSFSLNAKDNKGTEEKNSGPSEEADTSNQGPTEQYVDSAVQPHDSDSQTGSDEVSNKTKQAGAIETKVEETSEYPEIIPSAWINAKKMQDRMVNQTGKPTKEQSEILRREPTNVPSGLVSDDEKEMSNETSSQVPSYRWKVCNVTAGPDYIPCLDNVQAIKKLKTTRHYEHRERHCPDEAPVCLVPLPEGYKTPIKWPKSRDMIWFSNVPHTKLVEYKGAQNWVKVYDRYLTFPGGGTQFTFGALHYIDYLEKSVPDIAWGKRSRVVLDVGCGVASFGGYLFERDVLAMSLAPKDEHEAQVQFALERGIPAISAVMGTTRLPFPSMVFDIVHCARCRVPWHVEGGKLLLELNRLLRPGGYFIWSATPVYRKDSTNVGIWKDMSELMKSICWELVKIEKDSVNRKAAAIFRKPVTNNCYEERQKNDPPFCEESDDPSKAWYTPLQSCIHKVPTEPSERGSQWPPLWPSRLNKTPYWMKSYEGYGSFSDDYNHWKQVVSSTYLNGSGINWSSVRNVMDMRASYGGFAAALKDLKVWVMNVVPVNSSDTLPIIYERGLFGMYHDWCESFSTYPRSYDLLHANHLFSDLRKRCSLVAVMAEVDRILRPGGWLIVRDDAKTVSEVENMANSLHWNIKFTHSKDNEEVVSVEKTMWRPTEVETISAAIG